jgi:ABC-2 type transport system permease protein
MSGIFILTTLGIGLFVSTVANTRQQALMIAQFGFFIPFMYFSGFVFPIENMPNVIQVITYAVPLRYMLEAVRSIFLKGIGINILWPDAVALVIIGVLVLSLSILRFRRKIG